MRGFNIKDGVQFNCNLNGEVWRQGDCINGSLEIDDPSIGGNIYLVLGKKKKILNKDPKAFSIINKKSFSPSTEAQQFEFQLEKNCSISDTYLLFGSGDDLFEYGNMLLPLKEHKLIEDFLEVFTLFYKFKTKKLKSNKLGYVEATIEVPSSRAHTNIISLKMLLKIKGDDLIMSYQFVLNKINFESGTGILDKETFEVDKILTPKEYLIYGTSFNQEVVRKSIDEVFEQIKKKQLLI